MFDFWDVGNISLQNVWIRRNYRSNGIFTHLSEDLIIKNYFFVARLCERCLYDNDRRRWML